MGAMNFAFFQREGWSWMTQKPVQAFEVSLKDGKIVGIAYTVSEPDSRKRTELFEKAARSLPAPTGKASGKTATAYGWTAGTNARFRIRMDGGVFGTVVMDVIGSAQELKMMNYRVDDLTTLVQQIDLGAKALEDAGKRAPTPPRR
jgi:hypothetical protein